MSRNYFILATALTSLLSLVSDDANADTHQISAKEANFKAALIYKMGSYLSWIPPREQVNYCFVGEASMPISKVLGDKQSRGKLPKPIQVTNYQTLDINSLKSCDVVYAPHDNAMSDASLATLPTSVFTISNSSKALELGFIASIELYNKKPLLSISKNNLKNSTVSVNSRFLSYVDLR